MNRIILEATTLEGRTIWAAKGACREHPELDWFVEGVEYGAVQIRKETRRVCNDECPVRVECLSWALLREESGVWGGTSERERKRMRKQLKVIVESPQRLTQEIRTDILTSTGPSSHLFASISDPHLVHLGEIA